MATHSSILAWRSPWTEEPGRIQSMGLQRAGHHWATFTFTLSWNSCFSGMFSVFCFLSWYLRGMRVASGKMAQGGNETLNFLFFWASVKGQWELGAWVGRQAWREEESWCETLRRSWASTGFSPFLSHSWARGFKDMKQSGSTWPPITDVCPCKL